MRRLLPPVLLLLLALAGCVGEGPGTGGDGAGPGPGAEAPDGPVAAIDPCPADCWEPAIAIDAAGRVFVVTAHEGTLAVSEDGGRTFGQLGAPPMPQGAPPGTGPFDGTVAASPDGRLFYYSFVAPVVGAGTPVLGSLPGGPVGLQVAASSDGGRTWDSNVFLSLLEGPSEPVVSPWKSWLGFAPDGTLYLDYNSRGTGLWLTRSDDGGVTWSPFTRVNPPADHVISVFMGPPVVGAGGRLYVPYFGEQTPNFPNPFLPQGHALRVAVSDDRGATFTLRTVATAPPPDYVGAYFPAIAADAEGRLVLAHWDPQERMLAYASADGGETWEGPVPWSGEGERTFAAPWLELRDGVATLMYYGDAGMAYARASIAAGLTPPAERGILAEPSGGGDFIHFALDAAGRPVVPVPQADGPRVEVVWGPAAR